MIDFVNNAARFYIWFYTNFPKDVYLLGLGISAVLLGISYIASIILLKHGWTPERMQDTILIWLRDKQNKAFVIIIGSLFVLFLAFSLYQGIALGG
jgi:hypothetical protein